MIKRGKLLLLILCLALGARSQQMTQLRITVASESGEMLQGVTVSYKQQGAADKQTSTTDDRGICSLPNLKTNARYDITFTHVGYEENAIKGYLVREGEHNSILIRMKNSTGNLNEVLVIGYGTRKKSDVTGAISAVKGDEIKDQIVTSFDQALAGKMAGVQVAQTTGQPGGNVSIHIRGISSISAGNNPLFVIDGLPVTQDVTTNSLIDNSSYAQPLNPLASMDMNDIESIDVLKDAASTAIYGSRGSNGVVLITTKKGVAGKPRVSYSMNGGIQQVSKHIDVMNAYDYAKEVYDSHNNAYLDAVPAGSPNDPNNIRPNNPSMDVPPQVLPYLAGKPGLTDVDWQKAIFRNAGYQSHTLGVSGGNDDVRYYLSGNYMDQDGIIINSNFARYAFRGNVEGGKDKFRFGVNLAPSYTVNHQVTSEGPWSAGVNRYGMPQYDGVVANALTYAPLFPIYNPDGTYADSVNQWGYGQTNQLNPVATAMLIKDEVDNFRFTGSAYAEREFIKGLKYKLFFGTDYNSFVENFYRPTNLPIQQASLPSVAYGMLQTDQYISWDLENTLTYDTRLGAGHLSALAGYTAQKENQFHSYAIADKFPNDVVTTLNAGQPIANYSDLEQWSLISALGRVQYDLLGRYFLAASFREDGSSRFGSDHKWGVFPSVSGGWTVSKEAFWRPALDVVSNLKLRASYGLTGNFSIPNYGSLATLTSANYILGNQSLTSGAVVNAPANPALTWEHTASVDVGADLGFFRNSVTLSVDYYHSLTSDLLLNVPTASTSGFPSALQNIGALVNKGIEVLATYSKNIGRFWGLSLSGNIAFNRNVVTQLGPGNTPIIVTGGTGTAYFETQVGQPIGNYFLLVQNGIYKNTEDLQNNPHFSNSHVGDFKFVDVNKDGQLNALSDRAIVGNYQPKYIFGFNTSVTFRQLDLGFVIQGSQGGKVLDLFRRYIASSEGNFNNLNLMKGRYENPNDIGTGDINRADRIATGNNGTISTWHVEDGSFVRVKTISLGYSFTDRFVRRLGLHQARLYAATQNPFTFTKYSLFNPEISDRPNSALSPGEDYGSYPLARSYALGLNVSF